MKKSLFLLGFIFIISHVFSQDEVTKDGWSFGAAPGWDPRDPIVPVPEPITIGLLGLGGLFLRKRL